MANQENDVCTLHAFERNRYFYGKLLTVRDFEIEQSYFRGKDALINRIIHGGGIVCGLEVSNPQEDANLNLTINLTAGVAIDCCGREIVVSESKIGLDVTNKLQVGSNYLYLKYKECDKEAVPVLANASTCEEKCDYNRIKEIFEVCVSTESKVTISGTVDDGTTPIQNALVEAIQSGVVKSCALTGSDGSYTLLVDSGTYTIEISATGFDDASESVTVNGGTPQNFTLTAATTPADRKELKAELVDEYYEKYLKTCFQCAAQEDAKVLLAVIDKTVDENDNPTYNIDTTQRVIVPNNTMLYKLLSAHIADFNNPHQTTAAQVGALVSVEDVSNPGGNIDLIEQNAITISSSDEDNTITIGETHSARTDNPHQTTAAQVGALVSVDGVSNPGGDIDLVPDDAITIVPDDANDTITIGETHSARTDNPHSTTAAQVGALQSVDGVRNDGGNIDLIPANAITITPNDANDTITIGENHSALTNNPHDVTAAQLGALVSINDLTDHDGDITLAAGDNITITPTPATNTITIAATGGLGLESDLTTLQMSNWQHGGTMPLTQFIGIVSGNGLRANFIGNNGNQPNIDLGPTPNEVFIVAARIPLLNQVEGRELPIRTYHYEYLPGSVALDSTGTIAIFSLDDLYQDYLRQAFNGDETLTILVQLKCDFIIDQADQGRAVDGHGLQIINGTGQSGLVREDDGTYVGGIRGGVFESWFYLTQPQEGITVAPVESLSLDANGQASLNITATVTDAEGNSVTDTTVSASLDEGSIGNVTSPATNNGDGTYTVTYTADQEFGNATVRLTTRSGAEATVALTVVDDLAPTVVLTADASRVSVGDIVTFDGSQSTDNVAIASYSWDLDGDGFEDATGPGTVTFTYDQTGTFTAELTVTDTAGNSATNEVEVVVNVPSTLDGSGTATITPSQINANSENTQLTLTYTAEGSMDGGTVQVTIPAPWSAPEPSNTTADSTGRIGTLVFGRGTVTIPIRTLPARGTITIDYGVGRSGVTAPGPGTYEFRVESSGSASGTLTPISASPSVTVVGNIEPVPSPVPGPRPRPGGGILDNIVRTIGDSPQINITRLSEALGVDRRSLRPDVDRLTDAGVIRRDSRGRFAVVPLRDRIINAVEANPGMTRERMSPELSVDAESLNTEVEQLSSEGIIREDEEGFFLVEE